MTLGFVLGCRPLLSLFISIHAGALMDRIGTRRVLLFIAFLSLTTPFLYPLAPFVWALILIQLVSGTCDSIGWLGAQTLVGQLMRGRTHYAGRLSAIVPDRSHRGSARRRRHVGFRRALAGVQSGRHLRHRVVGVGSAAAASNDP